VEIRGGGGGGMGGAVFMSSLSEGVRYSLRGYESATFVGVPDDPESPPTPDQLKWRQSDETPKLHLVSKFVFAARGGIKAATASTQEGNK
jgi:hypothetical protein